MGLGLAKAGAPGLLVGDVIGRVAGGGGLAILAYRDRPFARVTGASLRAAAGRYRRFPLLTTWSNLFTIGSLQLPSILFSAGFGAAAAGLYALSYKMLVLPTMLVAQAVGQVFLARAATLSREPEALRRLTERTALALFACGLPVFCAVALGGPRLFATVMGSQWEQAGRYAQALAPWFAVWLVSNPLSGLLSVREWQGSALAFAAFEFALRLGALLIGTSRGSPMLAVAPALGERHHDLGGLDRALHARRAQLDRPPRRSGRQAGRPGRRVPPPCGRRALHPERAAGDRRRRAGDRGVLRRRAPLRRRVAPAPSRCGRQPFERLAVKIVYVTQRLPFGEGETFVVPEVEALLAAGHELLIVPRRSRDAVVHDNVGALLPRTRGPAARRRCRRRGGEARSYARRAAQAGAFWRLRRTRPRRRRSPDAVATAQGIWLARIARESGARTHIHAHSAHPHRHARHGARAP